MAEELDYLNAHKNLFQKGNYEITMDISDRELDELVNEIIEYIMTTEQGAKILGKKFIKKLDLTPTWMSLYPELELWIMDGSNTQRRFVCAELKKLCELADNANALDANALDLTMQLAAKTLEIANKVKGDLGTAKAEIERLRDSLKAKEKELVQLYEKLGKVEERAAHFEQLYGAKKKVKK